MPPPVAAAAALLLLLLAAGAGPPLAGGVEVLSKSRLESCRFDSGAGGRLSCDSKLVLDLAVPSGSSGGEASLVAQVVEVEEGNNTAMQAIRDPPIITINKSAVYAIYELSYIRDVAYKPVELFVKTHKCEPDAGEEVVHACERLRDKNGDIIEQSEPICCPCGGHRINHPCGNFFNLIEKGKRNTAHCVRFPGDWFHVFGIGSRYLGFSIRIRVKKGSSVSEVIVGPENKTVVSRDNFLRAHLIGDFVSYTNVPSFEGFYLVTPRTEGGSGLQTSPGNNISKWMLLERTRFGVECDKIGVDYEAFRNQPAFCSSALESCLHGQLWYYWQEDQNRISRKQLPQYMVQGRFERINQHPNAGSLSFSIGITEVLNTNLVIELSADDIEYVYQRSPGKILNISVPTFESLSQFGTAKITIKNTGNLEASYSLTFDCLSGISYMEEQFVIMKPDEVTNRSFYLRPATDQAAKYKCAAILKASDFSELDRAECQFTTRAMVLETGSQIVGSTSDSKKNGNKGFLETIKSLWNNMWRSVIDFFTGKACNKRCWSFFDFSCHVQYICASWIVMFGLLLATLPAVMVLIWLLHQKGVFDPLYDWWEDRFLATQDQIDPIPSKVHKHGHHHGDPQRSHHEHKTRKSGQSHRIPHKHEQHHGAVERVRRGHGHGHRHRHDLAVMAHEDEHEHRHGKAPI